MNIAGAGGSTIGAGTGCAMGTVEVAATVAIVEVAAGAFKVAVDACDNGALAGSTAGFAIAPGIGSAMRVLLGGGAGTVVVAVAVGSGAVIVAVAPGMVTVEVAAVCAFALDANIISAAAISAKARMTLIS